MTDAHLSLADGGPDDLPRTLRREREAQREARERETRERAAAEQAYAPEPALSGFASGPNGYGMEPLSGTVTGIEIPFFRLMAFFVKAVFAAVPALIILGIILWSMGQMLTAYAPWLLKLKILITIPN